MSLVFRAWGKGWGKTLGKKTGTTPATPSLPLLVFPFLSLPPLVSVPRDWWLVLQRYIARSSSCEGHIGLTEQTGGWMEMEAAPPVGTVACHSTEKQERLYHAVNIPCETAWVSDILSVDVISPLCPVMHIWLLNGIFSLYRVKVYSNANGLWCFALSLIC